MRNTALIILGALLITGSTIQMTMASEHHARKANRAPVAVSEQIRNAYGSATLPSLQRDWSNYSEGYLTSGPAGR